MNTLTANAPKPTATPEQLERIRAQRELLIVSLIPDFQPEVEKIEASIQTTQNHYGRYMAMLSTVGGGSQGITHVIAEAIIRAGGNPQGVNAALNILFP